MINKNEDIVVNHYTNNYDEDSRFENKGKRLEYLTTLEYIHKYAKKGAKILEIGAGTGAYSIKLAKEGYDVTAVELVEKNVEVMKKNSKGVKNITCLQGDALDLSRFKDNTFDIVLNFGPLYHLNTTATREKSINETLRVCKKNGICMFAFISEYSTVWYIGAKNNGMSMLKPVLKFNGSIKNNKEIIFYTYGVDEFEKQFVGKDTQKLNIVAVDSIGPLLSDKFDNMNDEDYKDFFAWHLKTCEQNDILGLSCHLLYVCKKTN